MAADLKSILSSLSQSPLITIECSVQYNIKISLVTVFFIRYGGRPEDLLNKRCKNQLYDQFRGLSTHQVDSGFEPRTVTCSCMGLSNV